MNLYNPFSVLNALEAGAPSNFWVDTGEINETIRRCKLIKFIGRYAPLSSRLWHGSQEFRDNIYLLISQKSVELDIDDHITFSRCRCPPFIPLPV